MRVSERGKERRNVCRGRGIFYSKNVNKVSSYNELCFKFIPLRYLTGLVAPIKIGDT